MSLTSVLEDKLQDAIDALDAAQALALDGKQRIVAKRIEGYKTEIEKYLRFIEDINAERIIRNKPVI